MSRFILIITAYIIQRNAEMGTAQVLPYFSDGQYQELLSSEFDCHGIQKSSNRSHGAMRDTMRDSSRSGVTDRYPHGSGCVGMRTGSPASYNQEQHGSCG